MYLALAPMVAFALSGSAPSEREVAAAAVAEAIVDADQIVAVHEAAGVIVFDLDRAGELFQLTIALDDDGRVTDSTVDWVGPTGHATGIAPTAVAAFDAVERIELDRSRRVILRGGRQDVTLALVARG
jgi:hypothetical protein